jgi:hypothetical protein
MKQLGMNTTAMRIGAWCGPVLVLFFFIGLVPLAGFVPPPDPDAGATEIRHLYTDDLTAVRIGLLMSTVAVALFFPWGATIAVLTRRNEERFPILSYTQVACIAMCGIVALFTCLVWSWGAFRPDEISPDTTRSINDFGWFLYLYTWPPFSVWALAIGLAIIWDKSETPAFPRWAAYFNFWLAFLLVPAGLMLFFKTGPFAFDGLITFWVPTVVFFAWIPIMTGLVLRAVSRYELAAAGTAAATEDEATELATAAPAPVS